MLNRRSTELLGQKRASSIAQHSLEILFRSDLQNTPDLKWKWFYTNKKFENNEIDNRNSLDQINNYLLIKINNIY